MYHIILIPLVHIFVFSINLINDIRYICERPLNLSQSSLAGTQRHKEIFAKGYKYKKLVKLNKAEGVT